MRMLSRRSAADKAAARDASLYAHCPAAKPEDHAHWKLWPPRCPVTSTTSPMKYRPGTRQRRHRFRGKLPGVDAAQRHLGLVVAERPRRNDPPIVERRADRREALLTQRASRAGEMQIIAELPAPLLCESMRQMLRQKGRHARGAFARAAQPCARIDARQQIDVNPIAAVPVGGNLQNRGSGQAAVREQKMLAKPAAVARDLRIDRHAREIAEALERRRLQRKRHQRRARRNDTDAELLGDAISQAASRRSSAPSTRPLRRPARSPERLPARLRR